VEEIARPDIVSILIDAACIGSDKGDEKIVERCSRIENFNIDLLKI